MAKQVIQLGSAANDGTGDPLRTAFGKVNSNFTELYNFNSSLSIPTDISQLTDTTHLLGAAANTGDVTFTGNIIQGTGYELSLSPGTDFTTGNYTQAPGPQLGPQYFRFRGGDNYEHLHFDTSNNNNFDLYVGDDLKYVKLSKDGPIVIGTSGNTNHTWSFNPDATVELPNNTLDAGSSSIDIKSSNYAELWYHGVEAHWHGDPTRNSEAYIWTAYDGSYIQNYRDSDGVNPSWNHWWQFKNDGSLNVPGKITGTNVLSVWTSNIDSINLGVDTEVNLQDWVFTGPVTGQVAIQGVVGTTEINGTWYFQATNPWSFRLYSDSQAQNPVDSTTWTAYVSGGTASEINSNGVAIGAGNKQWTFGDNGYLKAPGNIVVGRALDGDESHFVVDASDYWTSIQWKNMTSLQDPGATPFECQAQLLRVFANDNTVTNWCNIQNPREELVAVTAVKPSGTDYNGLMLSTSNGKIPDAPYNDGVGTRHDWIFGGNGSLVVPTLNGNARTGWGNNFQFEKSNNQKIISTQNGTVSNQTVERLVISGGDSYYDGSTYHGEGGDIYLWAGRGENGGDIKVDAGNALSGQEGGTIKIRGGNSDSGTGGFVEIWTGSGATGAPITLSTWNSGWNQWIFESNGNLTLPNTAYIDSGIPTLKTTQDFSIGVGYPQKVWNFDQLGKITLPIDGDIVNSNGESVIKSLPQNQQSSYNDYTLQLSDAGKHILKDEGDGYGVLVPTNANVAFPIGTVVTVVSGNSWTYIYPVDGGTTEVWGAGYNQTSTSWYIPQNSMATLLKIGTDKWMLSGAGLAID